MRIIQISDSHISHDFPQRSTDLGICVEHINKEKIQPDLVVHTGDITHNGLIEEYRIAREQLDQLSTPYCVLAGNKDKRKELSSVFSDNDYLQLDNAFIQYAIEYSALRVIVLDTVCESDNRGELCKTRLQQIDNMLSLDQSKPAVIFMHHSPFKVNEIPQPEQFVNWSEVEKLESIFSHHAHIDSIFCGHVHRNVEGSLGHLPVSVLSCLATDLRKGKLSEYEKTRPMYKVLDLPLREASR